MDWCPEDSGGDVNLGALEKLQQWLDRREGQAEIEVATTGGHACGYSCNLLIRVIDPDGAWRGSLRYVASGLGDTVEDAIENAMMELRNGGR